MIIIFYEKIYNKCHRFQVQQRLVIFSINWRGYVSNEMIRCVMNLTFLSFVNKFVENTDFFLLLLLSLLT